MDTDTSSTTPPGAPLTPDAFEAALRAQESRYHHAHPFHTSMHEGRLSQRQVQHWVANRFCYQQSLPLKDAAILSNCPDVAARRRWIERIVEQDGIGSGQGGLEGWLRLAEAVGLGREELVDGRHVVPGVRFSVDAYLNFARIRPWIEAVAASLTEFFVPDLMNQRIAAFRRHYSWVDAAGLAYFDSRRTVAKRDSDYALELVKRYCTTREQQDRAIAAVVFKCDVLWSLLDAIEHTSAGWI